MLVLACVRLLMDGLVETYIVGVGERGESVFLFSHFGFGMGLSNWKVDISKRGRYSRMMRERKSK